MDKRSFNSSLDDQKKMLRKQKGLEQKAFKKDVLNLIKRLDLLEQEQLESPERINRLDLLAKELWDLRGRLKRMEQLEQKSLKQKPPKQKPPK